jgi:hypothetical protein
MALRFDIWLASTMTGTLKATEEFVEGKYGITHVHSFFYGELGDAEFERANAELLSHTIDEDLYDDAVFEMIGRPVSSSLGDILHALEEDLLIKDGHWNVFYTGPVAVSLKWMPEGGWRINAWQLNGSSWKAGCHIFFPKD